MRMDVQAIFNDPKIVAIPDNEQEDPCEYNLPILASKPNDVTYVVCLIIVFQKKRREYSNYYYNK
jgi:hypothetical protein